MADDVSEMLIINVKIHLILQSIDKISINHIFFFFLWKFNRTVKIALLRERKREGEKLV